MTVVHKLDDKRFMKSAAPFNSFQYGLYYKKDAVGGDRAFKGDTRPNNWDCTIVDTLQGEYKYRWKEYSNPWNEQWVGPLGITVTQLRPWTSSDDLALLGKLAAKYREHDWNVGVFVGELGKTVDLLASRIRQFARATIALKRGDVSGFFKYLAVNPQYGHTKEFRNWANSSVPQWYEFWLEARYAWRPLAYDIYNLSEAVAKLDKPRQVRLRASAFIGKTLGSSVPYFHVKGTGRYSKQIIAYLAEKQPTIPEYLGLTNPGAILWELIPFSFVADWFIPIGNYIQTRNVIAQMEGTFVTTTYDWHRAKFEGMDAGYLPDFVPPFQSEYSEPSGWSSSRVIKRVVTTSLDVPLPSFRNPLGKSPGTRLMDAVSLAVAVFSKRQAGSDSLPFGHIW